MTFSFLLINTLNQVPIISFVLKILLIINNISFIIYLINFLKYKEIEIKFKESRIFYEESSWFDGQFWEKSFLIIKNDNLITTQEINPITRIYLKKLRLFFFINIPLSIYFIN